MKSGGLVKHGCQVCLVTGTVATCSQSRNSFTLAPRTITPSRVQAAASAGIVNTASGAVRCLSSPVRYSDTCTVVECQLEKCISAEKYLKCQICKVQFDFKRDLNTVIIGLKVDL